MRKSIIGVLIMIAGFTTLTGCAQRSVQLSDEFWQTRNQKVSIATFKAPEPEIHRKGNQGLIDYAINTAVSSKMSKALKRLDLSWYNNLYLSFAERLKKQKIHTNVLTKQFEKGKKEHEILLSQAAGDKILTLELRAIGARRTYYGFIPTGAPTAYCVLVGELMDPKDKKVWWHHETEIITPVNGPWDQSPDYPNLMSTLHIAIQEAKQEMIDSFFSGR